MTETYDIEKKPVEWRGLDTAKRLQKIVETLKLLEVGESFLVDTFSSNHSIAINVVGLMLDRKYRSTETTRGRRIGRVA